MGVQTELHLNVDRRRLVVVNVLNRMNYIWMLTVFQSAFFHVSLPEPCVLVFLISRAARQARYDVRCLSGCPSFASSCRIAPMDLLGDLGSQDQLTSGASPRAC
jgi:hypothetical protein